MSESLWVGAPLHCALHDLTRVLWDGFRQDLLRLRSGIPTLLYGRPRLQKENIKSSSANIFKVQTLSDDVNDLIKFDEVMQKFESTSGAILSRNIKSKVIGLGLKTGKQDCLEAVKWMRVVT